MPKNFKSRPLFSNPVPKEIGKPRIKWKVLPIAWLALKRTAMVLGFLVLFQIIIALIVFPAVFKQSSAPSFPKEMVLFLTFDGDVAEMPEPASFAEPFGGGHNLTVRQIVDTLDRAAADNRVKGLMVRMNEGSIGLVHAQEIREALLRFKQAGKFAYIYSSSYGDSGGDLGRYYFASAFDEIWMQPMGIVTINGMNAEMPFLRGVLDKIGVEPNMFQRKDYKTAYENLTNRSISQENKEMLTRLVGDIRDEALRVIPQARDIDVETFGRYVDQGLFTADEAKEAGLITHADYADVLVSNIKENLTGDREAADDIFVSFQSYAKVMEEKAQNSLLAGDKSKIALIYAVGAIMPSSGSPSPAAGTGVAAADVIAPAILAAADDDAVKAIVLRIDSPGGSPTASESILRAVEKAQEKGKPVIVSMGAVAASGGYWIAAYADKIFVSSTTITGSIGVVGGKFSLAGLWDKLDVNWDGVQWGKNAGMWSFNEAFSASEAERVNAMLDAVYHGFITRVAKGRKMGLAEVDAVAGGRVWSGRRAVEIGLADEIGGLDAALDYTAELLERESRKDLSVIVLPKPKTALEQFVALLEGQVTLGHAMRDNAALLEWLEPVSGAITRVQSPHDFVTYQPIHAP